MHGLGNLNGLDMRGPKATFSGDPAGQGCGPTNRLLAQGAGHGLRLGHLRSLSVQGGTRRGSLIPNFLLLVALCGAVFATETVHFTVLYEITTCTTIACTQPGGSPVWWKWGKGQSCSIPVEMPRPSFLTWRPSKLTPTKSRSWCSLTFMATTLGVSSASLS